jgi:hypothetical protein
MNQEEKKKRKNLRGRQENNQEVKDLVERNL